MSVALEICRIAEGQVGRAALSDVLEVAVEVGRDSCIEPANLEFCLEELLSRPPFGRAVPILIRRPGDVLRVRYLEIDDGAAGEFEAGGAEDSATDGGAAGGAGIPARATARRRTSERRGGPR